MPIGAFKLNAISYAVQQAFAVPLIVASGGTVTYPTINGVLYKVHTFTTSGANTFIVSKIDTGATVDILLVGGGGAGGGTTTATYSQGGGGGGGAVSYQTGVSITPQSYSLSVGAGGTGVSGANGNPGTQTTGLGYTAAGGGAGTLNSAGDAGGGSGTQTTSSWVSTAGTYAYKGGNAFGSGTTTLRASGGGAGAGGPGTNAASNVGGNGGIGIQNNIAGNNSYYAAGGGGSGTTIGSVYDSTGTLVSTASAGAGVVNGVGNTNSTGTRGGGGGGARNTVTTARIGGNGFSGIIIIRYPLGLPDGGTTSYYVLSNTLYRSHSFTTPGAQSFIVPSSFTTPVDYLMYGGGGGGGGVNGNRYAGGGGGGGQVITGTGQTLSSGSNSFTIGASGTAGGQTYGTRAGDGGSTIAFGSTAQGGGGGANGTSGSSTAYTGGGGSDNSGSGNAGGTGSAYNGGASAPGSGSGTGAAASGGGGGAAGNGTAGVAATKRGGDGGAGVTSTITGTSVVYGRGGGGSGETTAGTPNGRATVSAAGASGSNGGGGGGALSTAAAASNGGGGSTGGVIICYPVTQVTSLTYQTNVTASNATSITMPTIQVGDLAVLINTAVNTTTTVPTSVAPSGWTQITGGQTATSLGTNSRAYYKVCTGAESGTAITTMSYTSTSSSVIIIYRPNIPITIVQNNTNSQSSGDSALNNQSFLLATPTVGPFIGMAYWYSTGSVTTRTSTVTATREIANGTNQYTQLFENGTTNITNPYSNGTISIADYGTNVLQNWILQVY
jgi:hypothetical protein